MLAAGAVSVLIEIASAFLYHDVLALPVPSDSELIPVPVHRHSSIATLSTGSSSRNAAIRAILFAWDVLGRARAWIPSAFTPHTTFPGFSSSAADRVTLVSDDQSDMTLADAVLRWKWISVVWEVWRELWDLAGLSGIESEELQAEFVAVSDLFRLRHSNGR
jgi:hypothetical protein